MEIKADFLAVGSIIFAFCGTFSTHITVMWRGAVFSLDIVSHVTDKNNSVSKPQIVKGNVWHFEEYAKLLPLSYL